MEYSPCDNPLCDRYFETIDDNFNTGRGSFSHQTQYVQTLNPENIGETGFTCLICPNDGLIECALGVANDIGIILTTTGPNGNITNITAPNGLFINNDAIDRSINRFNQQLPTGSFSGYISSIFDDLSTSLIIESEQSLIVILGSIFLLGFVLFAIICIILIAYGMMDAAVGITIIFIGLYVVILTVIVSYTEAYYLATNLQKKIFSTIDPVLDTFKCALTSSVCCYIGASCCCPGGLQELCGM